MRRISNVMVVVGLLTGCGAEVAGTAVVTGVSRVQEAQQARQSQEQFRQKLDAALQAGQQQRENLDKAAGQ